MPMARVDLRFNPNQSNQITSTKVTDTMALGVRKSMVGQALILLAALVLTCSPIIKFSDANSNTTATSPSSSQSLGNLNFSSLVSLTNEWLAKRAVDSTSAASPQVQHPANRSSASPASILYIQVTAIHVARSEFPLSRLLFKLTLRLALDAVKQRLEQRGVRLLLNVRSANTCSRQYAGAVAAEEYYKRKARLFIVSGCDDAIRGVSRLASGWRVPVMTAAGFGADLNDKSVHRTLVRVSFSLMTAVQFLVKILKSFEWQKINLIVDESDSNSLALRESIENHLFHDHEREKLTEFQVKLNVISLDLQALLSGVSPVLSTGGPMGGNGSLLINQAQKVGNKLKASNKNTEDKWPNERTDVAVRDALLQSSLFSRVNILLIPQQYLRKFMLSVHDQNMANGLYTFINMPLILIATDDQMDGNSYLGSGNSVTSSSGPKQQQQQQQQQSYAASTGDNVFVWRSLLSSRNAQAKQAFESLMSIYLRTPTTKAYVYFASKLIKLANSEYAIAATTTTQATNLESSRAEFSGGRPEMGAKIQLSVNPYSASFYDCIQIYANILDEKLGLIEKEMDRDARDKLQSVVHVNISRLMRNRRFDNMITGTILINENGDRDADYALDDLNPMTGKFEPVIVYKGQVKETERLSRIHWSSDESVGPTIDNVDCQLTGTCPSKPLSKFLVTLLLMAAPLGLVMGTILYFVYSHISLESKLVDYWWKINYRDIEIITTRRKLTHCDGSSVATGGESHVSSVHGAQSVRMSSRIESGSDKTVRDGGGGPGSEFAHTTITKVTGTSGFASTAFDICYGEISLGIYKLAKVALKPIGKFQQSRKLMIELRTLKGINHNNLCRFVGIVTDEPYAALVSEFCPKGSLREFFQNESMVIDRTFKYSIINDILAGLLYLHSSPLEFHGRLKSSNCLVSSRFVVKLSDYGLLPLHEQLDENIDDRTIMKKQLWRAPEHLKSRAKYGSKKGDVYSFGLLLYEIITNNLPFYDSEKNDYIMPLKTLYNELKSNGPSEKTGPDISIIDTTENDIGQLVELMEQCWTYDTNKRPSLLVVSTALKRITRGTTSKKLLENLTGRMEQYTNNLESLVDAKLATLVEEKLRTEELLYHFVPKSIASRLKEGQSVEPEAFDCVTVLYSDIVGFTSLSSESTPIEVIDFLSDLYLCFDETLEQYDIFKVDTIGDAYIVASGLPQRNEGKHVMEIAHAAIELRERLANFKIPHKPNRSLQMRVGIHSGPCIAGIVGGLKMPKYCVFGDTLSIGKYMEYSGLPMKLHITEQSKNLLERIGGFKIEARVPKITKDGLPFQTYWLESGSQ